MVNLFRDIFFVGKMCAFSRQKRTPRKHDLCQHCYGKDSRFCAKYITAYLIRTRRAEVGGLMMLKYRRLQTRIRTGECAIHPIIEGECPNLSRESKIPRVIIIYAPSQSAQALSGTFRLWKLQTASALRHSPSSIVRICHAYYL